MKFSNWYTNALGFAAMICGMLALLLSFVPVIGIAAWALAPISIILGVVSLRNDTRGPSIAGIVLGFSALTVCIVWIAVMSGGTQKADMDKAKAAADLDSTMVTMSKRDPGPAPVIPTVDPVTTRAEVAEGRTSAFDPPKADAPPEAITLGEYNGLADGMGYDQAVHLIGSPGRMTSDMNTGPMAVKSFEWTGAKPGTFGRAQFQNDRLVSKSQTGLE